MHDFESVTADRGLHHYLLPGLALGALLTACSGEFGASVDPNERSPWEQSLPDGEDTRLGCPECGRTARIDSGAAANHADPTIAGSIASALGTAQPGDTVLLLDRGPYVVEQSLIVPAGVTLASAPDITAAVDAGPGLLDGTVVQLGDDAALEGLRVNGQRYARHLVRAAGTDGIRIDGCELRGTRNDWPAGSQPRCHGLLLQGSGDALVRDSVIHDIGYPKVNGRSWGGICAAIFAPESTDLVIDGNIVRDTLTAGIDFTSSIGVRIVDNDIARTGRNIEYWVEPYDLPVADGITAYSNDNGHTYQEILVARNRVADSGNHGIHLSGRDLEIIENRIESPYAQGILIDDHRAPADCSSNVRIRDNRITGIGSEGERHQVYIGRNHKPGAIAVTGNGGDVYYRPSSTCE